MWQTAHTANKTCWLFVGSQYYRYTRKLGVHSDYPKPVSLWRGLPSAASISAAFQAANSATYFFTGQHFYRFNDVAFNVRTIYSTFWAYALHFAVFI